MSTVGPVKIMNEIAEVIAFLVPDFLALGVGVSVFFGAYCGVTTLGLLKTQAGNSSLVFSLLLAYAAAVAFNVASSLASLPSATASSEIPRRPCSEHPSIPTQEAQRFRASHSQGTLAATDVGPGF